MHACLHTHMYREDQLLQLKSQLLDKDAVINSTKEKVHHYKSARPKHYILCGLSCLVMKVLVF